MQTQLTLVEVKDLLLITQRIDIKGNEALGLALLQQKLTTMKSELEQAPAAVRPSAPVRDSKPVTQAEDLPAMETKEIKPKYKK